MGCSSHAGLRLGARLAKTLVAMRHPGKLEGLGGWGLGGRRADLSCSLGDASLELGYSGQNRCALRVLPVGGAAEASCEHREGRWERSAPRKRMARKDVAGSQSPTAHCDVHSVSK